MTPKPVMREPGSIPECASEKCRCSVQRDLCALLIRVGLTVRAMRPQAERWWLSLAGIGLCIEPVKSLKSGVVCAPSSFGQTLTGYAFLSSSSAFFSILPALRGALFSFSLMLALFVMRCPELCAWLRRRPVSRACSCRTSRGAARCFHPRKVCSSEPAGSPVRCASHALVGGWALLRAAANLRSADATGLEWRVRFAVLLATGWILVPRRLSSEGVEQASVASSGVPSGVFVRAGGCASACGRVPDRSMS